MWNRENASAVERSTDYKDNDNGYSVTRYMSNAIQRQCSHQNTALSGPQDKCKYMSGTSMTTKRWIRNKVGHRVKQQWKTIDGVTDLIIIKH